jgi:hypothetical protein
MTSTISTAISSSVTLGSGAYAATLTITDTGSVIEAAMQAAPAYQDGAAGLTAITLNQAADSLYNDGDVSGGAGGNGGQGTYNVATGTSYYSGKGGNGGVGVSLSGGALTNDGTISGGQGGDGGGGTYIGGGYGGGGGVGLLLSAGSAINDGSITGGQGGAGGHGANGSFGGIGGDGGTGVAVSGGTLTNDNSIIGGQGGSNGNYAAAGTGGIGISVYGGTVTNEGAIAGGAASGVGYYSRAGGTGLLLGSGLVTNEGSITGGAAGDGFYAGGGSGVSLTGGSLINEGSISGGGATGYSGAYGGLGALLSGGTLTNNGFIVGGAATGSHDNGGDGVSLSGGTLTNHGTITGGQGGMGAFGGSGAALHAGTLTNDGSIYGGAANGGGGGAGSGVSLYGAILTNDGTITGGQGVNGGNGGVGACVYNATLVNAGTISGAGGADAVQFGYGTEMLIVDPGAVFNGQVAAHYSYTERLALAGTTTATLTGLGTQFTGFTVVELEEGAHWVLADVTPDSTQYVGLLGDDELGLATSGIFPDIIAYFNATDTIDLTGLGFVEGATATLSSNGDTLLVTSGGVTDTLTLYGTAPGTLFTALSDGAGGTDVQVTPCYYRGTRILTLRGEVPVEKLREGDLVMTLGGQGAPLKPVIWIGHTDFDAARHPHPEQVWPVRILKDAFGEGMPRRGLLVSPGHACLIDGVLMQAENLINGATIFQDKRITRGSYFHVELAAHDIILSEGVPAETYLDTGNRRGFANAASFTDLFPDFSAKDWTQTCRDLVRSGARLAAARARLRDRAFALGFGLTQDADVHLVSSQGDILRPELVDGVRYTFRLKRPGRYRLASRCWVPAEHEPDSMDRRVLGVRVVRIASGANQMDIALSGDAFPAEGWHALEGSGDDIWRWTKGQACLPWAEDTLTVELHAGAGYWIHQADGRAKRRAAG